ncbi:MAG: hypothetical protein KF727_12600 [Microbacteriaceae bacterium]|nr:hypothetical protein [Microbacteriaceae bacterium]
MSAPQPVSRGNLALAPRPVAPARPRLEAAPAPAPARRPRPRLAHGIAIVAGIGVILLIQLALSFVLADGAYYIAGLQSQQRDLLREQHALQERLELLGSTQNLTANAEALGMVASGNPMFLDLGTGKVSGSHSKDRSLPDNLIANSLLDGSTVIDPAALAAAQAAEDASGDTGQSSIVQGDAVQGDAVQSGGQSTTPGLLPSPITH